ncbi:MAG TPA: DNA mismatch repair endonuclease MutL [Pirellulales bacterium]|nr:DNA mismatch repair endonuclease MutL [Pirellulales bacterium]
MPPIRQLPPSVVNKIAAGEVIERPASVVKELVENSLDAGAARIDVSVEQGGTELVRVVDDGGGIPPDELLLAVASHATSKLTTADDLFRVRTLGFRGEALASIAEVSRFTLRSRAAERPDGAELEVVAGQPADVVPCGCPQGTAIEVRNLFFNTPVRRKFLRSVQTEMGHVSEVVTRLSLAHPRVHFTLRHNARTVYDLAPNDDWLERIAGFFGRDLSGDLIWVENRDGDIHLRGFVGRPNLSRPNARMQYLFLNGRSIRDRSLAHALGEAYRGLLLTGRFPVAFLCFEVPPDQVDVNVHPTKLEVRFQDGGRLYSQLLGTLRTKFLTTDLTHRIDAGGAAGAAVSANPAQAVDPERAAELRRELVEWAKGQVAAWAPAQPAGGNTAQPANGNTAQPVGGSAVLAVERGGASEPARQTRFDLTPPSPSGEPLRLSPIFGRPMTARAVPDEPASTAAVEFDPSSGAGTTVAGTMVRPAQAIAALQIHNRYLVAESDEGVVVIDQHALHERILYEQFRTSALAGALESQHLLVPEPVDLSGPESAAVLQRRELLARLGIKVEPFGGDTVLVSSYPAMLAGTHPAELLRDLVGRLLDAGREPERRDLLDELLHMFACKAAVKAGDHLTSGEIAALLEQRHLAQDTHHCPHGRPTALVFTRDELDKQFKRT